MKFFLLPTLAAAVAVANPTPQSSTACTTAFTDRIIFTSTLPTFLSAKSRRTPSGCDWSDNGCTASPDNPFGFNFLQSCQRHDFGYRNFKAQNRFSDANKKRIDDQFLEDMNNQCATESNAGACRNTASVYYFAVRNFGSKKVKRDGQMITIEMPEGF